MNAHGHGDEASGGRPPDERELWERVRRAFNVKPVTLGGHWAFNFLNDPKRLAFVLSRYKFAAKMAPPRPRVLELGCSEGLGAPILAEFAQSYLGVDCDAQAVASARANWEDPKVAFLEDDFLGKRYGEFDLVVSMDVVEHVEPERERLFWDCAHANLAPDGVIVAGTPNATAERYASEASRRGHVNLFEADRLRQAMNRICRRTFLFSMNDEVVHTGFAPMAHFLIAAGCFRREVPA